MGPPASAPHPHPPPPHHHHPRPHPRPRFRSRSPLRPLPLFRPHRCHYHDYLLPPRPPQPPAQMLDRGEAYVTSALAEEGGLFWIELDHGEGELSVGLGRQAPLRKKNVVGTGCWRRWWCKIGGKPVSLRVEERYLMFTDASGVGVIREGKAGGWCKIGGKPVSLRVEER
eukprot:scaffold16157_cov115-Isochrysis_galbana.AAC.1